MKNNVVFGIIGLGLGLVIGFLVANSLNYQDSVSMQKGMPTVNSNMPAGHPEIPGLAPDPANSSLPDIQQTIDRAKQSPDDFDAQIKAAELYYRIQRFDEAINHLNAANKLKPDDRDLMIQLGNTYFDAKKYADARKWYEKALSIKADDAKTRTDLGLTYILETPPNYDQGIREFERSLSGEPKHIPTIQNMILAYARKGDTKKATEALAKLEAEDPNNSAISQLKEEITKSRKQ